MPGTGLTPPVTLTGTLWRGNAPAKGAHVAVTVGRGSTASAVDGVVLLESKFLARADENGAFTMSIPVVGRTRMFVEVDGRVRRQPTLAVSFEASPGDTVDLSDVLSP